MNSFVKGLCVLSALCVGGAIFVNCGGGSCEVPNPDYNPSDPNSSACLDVTAYGDPAAALTVVGASYTLTSPPVDESIQILDGAGASTNGGEATGGVLEVNPGDRVRISVPFSAPNGNVTAVGVRFGDGPIQVVEVPGAAGQTTGQMDVDVEVPPSVCNNLSQICHDIKCYEFAVTEAGSISAADINSIALKCGNCDEPSCQSLLTSCEEGQCSTDQDCTDNQACIDNVCVGQGDLRFTLSWTGSADADIYVTTPAGNTISYGNPSADGGQLDRDCLEPPSCTPVENIYFTNPLSGQYSVYVNNLGPDTANFTLVVATPAGQLGSDSGSLSNGESSSAITINF